MVTIRFAPISIDIHYHQTKTMTYHGPKAGCNLCKKAEERRIKKAALAAKKRAAQIEG